FFPLCFCRAHPHHRQTKLPVCLCGWRGRYVCVRACVCACACLCFRSFFSPYVFAVPIPITDKRNYQFVYVDGEGGMCVCARVCVRALACVFVLFFPPMFLPCPSPSQTNEITSLFM